MFFLEGLFRKQTAWYLLFAWPLLPRRGSPPAGRPSREVWRRNFVSQCETKFFAAIPGPRTKGSGHSNCMLAGLRGSSLRFPFNNKACGPHAIVCLQSSPNQVLTHAARAARAKGPGQGNLQSYCHRLARPPLRTCSFAWGPQALLLKQQSLIGGKHKKEPRSPATAPD